jgi:hypothetical protein
MEINIILIPIVILVIFVVLYFVSKDDKSSNQ